MSIFLNENSKVIVQGMTGSEGRKHTQRMLASGTAIVGGVVEDVVPIVVVIVVGARNGVGHSHLMETA